jgi:hypothetical protein
MSWNAGSRGVGQQAFYASDPAAAPKSFKMMFSASYDARDEASDFWTHLKMIEDGFVQRRALGCLVMPTSAFTASCGS